MENTQGPWEVVDRWNVLSGRRLIANCGGYFSNKESVVEENEANAQLIASAPDLYEACKQLWVQLDKRRIDYCLCGSLTEICWYCLMLQPIEKALAKAEGK